MMNNDPAAGEERTNTTTNGEEDPSSYPYDANQGAVRFPAWVALAMLSVLSWISMLSRRHLSAPAYKWAISVGTLSSIFGVISVVAYIFYRGIYMTQPPELGIAAFILALWSAGLPVIMNPSNGIAVSFTQVENANLYFASWASFFCILWICGSLGKELYGYDILATAKPMAQSKQGHWYALVAASMVVLSASIRIFRADECTVDVMAKAPICKQTKFAISAGVIGSVVSAAITYMLAGSSIGLEHEFLGAVIMLVIWCFGMGFITFGEGPGHSIGNLYFATWACFLLSILLVSECYKERLGRQEQQAQEAATSATSDLQVEELPPDSEFAIESQDDI